MDPIDLCFAGAAEQARLIRHRVVSARELIDATLRRIDELNPCLNAYRVVFDERALEDAADIEAKPPGAPRLPLLGVPVAIRDETDIAGEITAWGSAAHGPAKDADAEVVARLRRAGAVIVGKTHRADRVAVDVIVEVGHHPKSMGPRPHPRRVVRWLRRSSRDRDVWGCARFRWRRVGALSGCAYGAVRVQTAA